MEFEAKCFLAADVRMLGVLGKDEPMQGLFCAARFGMLMSKFAMDFTADAVKS